jgi:hypothetical protein
MAKKIELKDSLILQWKLNEVSGNIIKDSIGNNDGTYFGIYGGEIVEEEGKLSNSLSLHGRQGFGSFGDYVKVSDNPIFDFSEKDFSISFWIKTSDSMGYIIDKSTDRVPPPHPVSSDDGWRIRLMGGKVLFYMGDRRIYRGCQLLSSSTINNEEWTFVVITREASGLAKLFVNNNEEDSKDSSFLKRTVNDRDLFIGVNEFYSPSALPPSSHLEHYLIGSLDSICIFNKSISESEIDYLYKKGKGRESIK